jgi:hypothetical protein
MEAQHGRTISPATLQSSSTFARHRNRLSILGHATDRLDYIKGDEARTETIGSGQTVGHQEDSLQHIWPSVLTRKSSPRPSTNSLELIFPAALPDNHKRAFQSTTLLEYGFGAR